MPHALTWWEALVIYRTCTPKAEPREPISALVLDYEMTCTWVEGRIAYLAKHSHGACPA